MLGKTFKKRKGATKGTLSITMCGSLNEESNQARTVRRRRISCMPPIPPATTEPNRNTAPGIGVCAGGAHCRIISARRQIRELECVLRRGKDNRQERSNVRYGHQTVPKLHWGPAGRYCGSLPNTLPSEIVWARSAKNSIEL